MSISTHSVHSSKRYFVMIVVSVLLTSLLYLYTTNSDLLQPIVKVARAKIYGNNGKVFDYRELSNLYNETTSENMSSKSSYFTSGVGSTQDHNSGVSVHQSITTKGLEDDQNIYHTKNQLDLNTASLTSTTTTKSKIQDNYTLTGRITLHPSLNNASNVQPLITPSKTVFTTTKFNPVTSNNINQNSISSTSAPSGNLTHSKVLPEDPYSKFRVDCDRMWVTSHEAGRLGNIMCEYAHLMILHLEYGVQVGLLPAMHNSLRPLFPNLSIQRLSDKCLQAKNITTYEWPKVDALLRAKNLSLPTASDGYPCDATRLWKYRNIWREEFSFTKSIKHKADFNQRQSLNKWKMRQIISGKMNVTSDTDSLDDTDAMLMKASIGTNLERGSNSDAKLQKKKNDTNPLVLNDDSNPQNMINEMLSMEIKKRTKLQMMLSETNLKKIPDPMVIGVHVRRTDYIGYVNRVTGGGTVVGSQYFQKAFQYFREKYKNVLFMVSSDDRNWCHQMLEKQMTDVVVAPPGSPGEDMALLATSSHIVMSLGTYGFWAGVLSQGTIAYPKKLGKTREYFMSKNLNSINSSELIAIL